MILNFYREEEDNFLLAALSVQFYSTYLFRVHEFSQLFFFGQGSIELLDMRLQRPVSSHERGVLGGEPCSLHGLQRFRATLHFVKVSQHQTLIHVWRS